MSLLPRKAGVGPTHSVDEHAATAQWHSSHEPRFVAKPRDKSPARSDEYYNDTGSGAGMGHPLGVHAGTPEAAWDRQGGAYSRSRSFFHPVEVHGEDALSHRTDVGSGRGVDPHLWSDRAGGRSLEATQAVRSGKNVWYENDVEDEGALSVRAPRQNLKTWAETVVATPEHHPVAALRAVNSGVDLTYVPTDRMNAAKAEVGQHMVKPPGLKAHPMEIDRYTFDSNDDEGSAVTLHPVFLQNAPHPQPRDIGVPRTGTVLSEQFPGMESK